jgi:1-acyl-sn-glycerol-3-phosphate acyltransferase
MTPGIAAIADLPIPVLRAALPQWVAGHVDAAPAVTAAVEHALRARIATASDADLAGLLHAFATAGDHYQLYPASPFARALTRDFMSVMTPTRQVTGLDRLDRFLATGPSRRMVVANHLSYTDTQLTDSLLVLEGRAAFADRLVAIAGPKVYTDAWRRLAAISLNTRKTAQSSAVATEQGALSARDLAAVAFETLRDCERLMDQGYVVLLYPEGTRSRTGRLQPFLRASGRYTAIEGLQILPMVQTGAERVFPIDDPLMHPNEVRLAFGEPFVAADFPGRHGHGALAEVHARMAAELPEAYRPPEGQPPIG